MRANALTVDWEDWYHGLLDRPERWDGLPARLPLLTGRLLDLLAEHQVRATFFILGHAAERHPETVKAIHAAGHEIASHGHSHQFVTSQTPEGFRRDTTRAAGFLSDLVSERIAGYRASTFTITERTRWALDIVEECGFRYDSSIFPVKNPYYGWPGAPRYPHRLEGRSLWEFPLTTHRFAGRNVPLAGGFYLRLLPVAAFRAAYGRIHREGWPVVFYLHPWELDPDQPRSHYSPFWRAIRFTGLSRFPGRLRRLLTDFRWCPMRDVLAELEKAEQGRVPGGGAQG
jgi:polysaccharide deacetylase family protein (PEP-CTERM system associated)